MTTNTTPRLSKAARAVAVLRRARRLLSRKGGWTTGTYYNGASYCAIGAISWVRPEDNVEGLRRSKVAEGYAIALLVDAAGIDPDEDNAEGRVIGWNDRQPRKTKVIAAFDRAIAKAEAIEAERLAKVEARASS